MATKASGKAKQAATARRWNWSPASGSSPTASCTSDRLVGAADRVGRRPVARAPTVSGALKTLADQPFGKILLWLVAVGMVALALWQASEAIWGYRNRGGRQAGPQAGQQRRQGGALRRAGGQRGPVALGSGSSSSQSQQEATSGVLAWPGGQVIVVVAGLIIIGVGVAGVVKGVKKSFAEEIDTSSMSPSARKAVARLGQVGYIARGLALGVVGGLLGYAALTFDAQQAKGLDGAMRTILEQPFGSSCSPRWRWDSWPSACSPFSRPDTAGCDPRRSARAHRARHATRTARQSDLCARAGGTHMIRGTADSSTSPGRYRAAASSRPGA